MMAMAMMRESDTQTERERAVHRERHWARRLALQALYQWDISGGEAGELLDQFSRKEDIQLASSEYLALLVNGVLNNAEDLHRRLTPLLDRPLPQLDPVERTALRFACYELVHCPDVPIAVVLSEAARLTRKFGTEKGSRYVNAVLDRLAGELRRTGSA